MTLVRERENQEKDNFFRARRRDIVQVDSPETLRHVLLMVLPEEIAEYAEHFYEKASWERWFREHIAPEAILETLITSFLQKNKEEPTLLGRNDISTYRQDLWKNEEEIEKTRLLLKQRQDKEMLYEIPLLKREDQLSPETKAIYEKTFHRFLKECASKTLSVESLAPLDIALWLVSESKKSQSVFYLSKTVLLREAKKAGRTDILNILVSFPGWREIRKYFNWTRERTGITEERKTEKDMKTFEMLLSIVGEKDPLFKDALRTLVFCGARLSELKKISLETTETLVKVTIPLAKRGCRKKTEAPEYRELHYAKTSDAGSFFQNMEKERGNKPFNQMNRKKFEKAWLDARRKLFGEEYESQAWCPHALRHAFTAELKRWVREHAKDQPEHIIREYISRGIGHATYTSARLYGNEDCAHGIDLGLVRIL